VITLRCFVDQLFDDYLQFAGFAPPTVFVYCDWLGQRLLNEAGDIS